MTVKKRMIIAFGVIITLLLGVATFGVFKFNSIHGATNNLYEHPYKVNLAAYEIRVVLSECHNEIRNIVVGTESDAVVVASDVKNHSKIIEENLKTIETQFLGDKTVYNAFLAESKTLKELYEWILSNASDQAGIQSKFNESTHPTYLSVQSKLGEFLSFAKGKGEEFYNDSVDSTSTSITLFIIISLILILIAIALAYYNIQSIIKPLNFARANAEEISTGNLTEFDSNSKDEIGLTMKSIQVIVDNIKKASEFTEKIGQGEYETEFVPVGENDTLGHSLVGMRDKLQQVALEDERRNWAARGLAVFADILRSDSSDLTAFGQSIVSKLIEYLDANQGGIFLLNDVDPKDAKMELVSAYAYDRQKFLTKEIRKGEGLIGQSWEENNKIFLTNIPNNYINIVSGLGDASPGCVLIMPLKENDDIFGMIEIASFNVFEEHEIEFMERLAQSIGATFKNLKTNIQTTKLLEESQNMAEVMSEQEEEMRQNMEEIQATSETMNKMVDEKDKEITELKKKLRTLDQG